MTDWPQLKHTAVLRERLALEGARVADVGCGAGAEVIGFEPGARQLAYARAATPVGSERYVCARGEQLPLPDGCLDVLVYFNALHHVPVAFQAAALEEALRVVRPGGHLYIQEPLAEGAYFEMMQPIDDETEVRAHAYEALRAALDRPALEELEELVYLAPFREESFEAFRDAVIAIDDSRRQAVEAAGESLRQAFMAAGEQRDGAFWFEIPSRMNLLLRH